MRTNRSSLLVAVLLAGLASTASALENLTDSSVPRVSNVANLSGVAMPGNDIVADTVPSPEIASAIEGNNHAGSVTTVEQNGLHRSSVAAAPPLINAQFPNTALSSATFGIDLAAGILAYDKQQLMTVDGWSGSGAQSTGTITPAVDHDTSPPHGTQASSSV